MINQKHCDSAYLRQGTSYQYRDTDPDPNRHQNLIICSLAHCQPSLKILRKSVRKFLRKVANRQTDRQTDRQTKKQTDKNRQTNNGENITSLAEVKTLETYKNVP